MRETQILATQDDWYTAEIHGREGFVPRNYINIQLPSWYEESATRHSAEETLMYRELGAFLIRGSQSSPGNFSISVRYELDVQHFKVMKDNKGLFFLWTEKFASLNKMVEFYKTTSITKQKNICLREDVQQAKSISQAKTSDTTTPRPPADPTSNTKKQVVMVQALYDFHAEEPDELGFTAGDTIEVVDSSDLSWWTGKFCGRTGFFPSNYTQPI